MEMEFNKKPGQIDIFTRQELVEYGFSEEDIQARLVWQEEQNPLKQIENLGFSTNEALEIHYNWHQYQPPSDPEAAKRHAITESRNEYIRRGEAFDQNVDLDTLR